MDRLRQFWIGVGGVLESASLAHSTVRLTLSDGRTLEGVPARCPAEVPPRDQLAETGMPLTVSLAGATVEVQDVTEIVLVRPLQVPDTVPPRARWLPRV